MANLLTHMARGETALSVTMTAVSSVCAVVTVPLYLKLSIDFFDAAVGDDVSMLGTVARVFAITLIPLAIGMTLPRPAHRAGHRHRAELQARRRSTVFVLVVIGAVASEWDRVTESFGTVAPAALALNVAAMTRLVRGRPRRPAARPLGDGDRAGARRPQLDADDRGGDDDRRPAGDPGRGLQRVHVRDGRARSRC